MTIMQFAESAYYAELAEQQNIMALRERIERIVRWYVRSGEDDVADLTQECLLRAYKNLGTVRDLEKLEPWLKAIVRNTVFTWLRERKREQELCASSLDVENESDTYCLPEDDLLLYFILQEAMQTLSEADQQMLELRYGAGMSYREIAREIGLNEETVRKRISRAVERLRAHPLIKSIITEGG